MNCYELGIKCASNESPLIAAARSPNYAAVRYNPNRVGPSYASTPAGIKYEPYRYGAVRGQPQTTAAAPSTNQVTPEVKTEATKVSPEKRLALGRPDDATVALHNSNREKTRLTAAPTQQLRSYTPEYRTEQLRRLAMITGISQPAASNRWNEASSGNVDNFYDQDLEYKVDQDMDSENAAYVKSHPRTRMDGTVVPASEPTATPAKYYHEIAWPAHLKKFKPIDNTQLLAVR